MGGIGIVTGLLCAAVAAGPSVPANDGYPAWSPDGTRLVFESTRDGNVEIYSMDADGGDVTRLTASLAYDRVPSFSPDGAWVVFQSTRDSDAFMGPLRYQLYVMAPDGSDVRRLSNGPHNDGQARFSPDGRRIVFVSDREGGAELFVMDVDGGNVRGLTNDPALHTVIAAGAARGNPHWSADGSSVLFDTRDARTGVAHVYMLHVGTGRIVDLSEAASLPSGGRSFFPVASPDGRTFAFALDHDPGGNRDWEIWLRDGPSGAVQRLTHAAGNDFWQAFSPDGRTLAFASNRDGSYAIYTVPVVGGEPRRLTRPGAGAGPPRPGRRGPSPS